jgi:hypothetical protein
MVSGTVNFYKVKNQKTKTEKTWVWSLVRVPVQRHYALFLFLYISFSQAHELFNEL